MGSLRSLGQDDLHAIAGKGYFSGSRRDQAGITVTVPRPETSGNRGKGMYVKADLACDPAPDVYVCTAGEDPVYRYTRGEGGLQVRRYRINQCQNCLCSPVAPAARNAELPGGTMSIWPTGCASACAKSPAR